MGLTLKKCKKCAEYTIRSDVCPYCGSQELFNPNPGRFSLEDKYGKYRRELKRQTRDITSN